MFDILKININQKAFIPSFPNIELFSLYVDNIIGWTLKPVR